MTGITHPTADIDYPDSDGKPMAEFVQAMGLALTPHPKIRFYLIHIPNHPDCG